MGKRKDSMALFEAISRTKAKQGQVLPPHVGISPQPIKAESRTVLYTPPGDASTDAAAPGAAVPPSAAAARAQAQAAVQPPAVPAVAPPEVPVVQTSAAYDGQGSFVLTKVHLAGLIVVAAAVLIGVWYMTRPASQPASNGSGSNVATGGLGAEEALPTPPPTTPLFAAGKYYLVVQEGVESEDKAKTIVDWLNAKNDPEIQAVKRTNSKTGKWDVLTTKVFTEVPYINLGNDKVSYKAEPTRFAKKIAKLGEEYFREHRDYQFKQTRRVGNVDEFAPSYVRMQKDSF